jgi:hypothetical protein
LFHDSKPTPQCIHRCISLIRKYCMGDRWEVKCIVWMATLISHNFLNVQMRWYVYSLYYGASIIWIVVRFQYQEAAMWNDSGRILWRLLPFKCFQICWGATGIHKLVMKSAHYLPGIWLRSLWISQYIAAGTLNKE